jgi:hypothetical protein
MCCCCCLPLPPPSTPPTHTQQDLLSAVRKSPACSPPSHTPTDTPTNSLVPLLLRPPPPPTHTPHPTPPPRTPATPQDLLSAVRKVIASGLGDWHLQPLCDVAPLFQQRVLLGPLGPETLHHRWRGGGGGTGEEKQGLGRKKQGRGGDGVGKRNRAGCGRQGSASRYTSALVPLPVAAAHTQRCFIPLAPNHCPRPFCLRHGLDQQQCLTLCTAPPEPCPVSLP